MALPRKQIVTKTLSKSPTKFMEAIINGTLKGIVKKDIEYHLKVTQSTVKSMVRRCKDAGLVRSVPTFMDMRSISYRLSNEIELIRAFDNGQISQKLVDKYLPAIIENDIVHVLSCELPEWNCELCDHRLKQLVIV